MKTALHYHPTGPVLSKPHPNINGAYMVIELDPPKCGNRRAIVKTYCGKGSKKRADRLAAELNAIKKTI